MYVSLGGVSCHDRTGGGVSVDAHIAIGWASMALVRFFPTTHAVDIVLAPEVASSSAPTATVRFELAGGSAYADARKAIVAFRGPAVTLESMDAAAPVPGPAARGKRASAARKSKVAGTPGTPVSLVDVPDPRCDVARAAYKAAAKVAVAATTAAPPAPAAPADDGAAAAAAGAGMHVATLHEGGTSGDVDAAATAAAEAHLVANAVQLCTQMPEPVDMAPIAPAPPKSSVSGDIMIAATAAGGARHGSDADAELPSVEALIGAATVSAAPSAGKPATRTPPAPPVAPAGHAPAPRSGKHVTASTAGVNDGLHHAADFNFDADAAERADMPNGGDVAAAAPRTVTKTPARHVAGLPISGATTAAGGPAKQKRPVQPPAELPEPPTIEEPGDRKRRHPDAAKTKGASRTASTRDDPPAPPPASKRMRRDADVHPGDEAPPVATSVTAPAKPPTMASATAIATTTATVTTINHSSTTTPFPATSPVRRLALWSHTGGDAAVQPSAGLGGKSWVSDADMTFAPTQAVDPTPLPSPGRAFAAAIVTPQPSTTTAADKRSRGPARDGTGGGDASGAIIKLLASLAEVAEDAGAGETIHKQAQQLIAFAHQTLRKDADAFAARIEGIVRDAAGRVKEQLKAATDRGVVDEMRRVDGVMQSVADAKAAFESARRAARRTQDAALAAADAALRDVHAAAAATDARLATLKAQSSQRVEGAIASALAAVEAKRAELSKRIGGAGLGPLPPAIGRGGKAADRAVPAPEPAGKVLLSGRIRPRSGVAGGGSLSLMPDDMSDRSGGAAGGGGGGGDDSAFLSKTRRLGHRDGGGVNLMEQVKRMQAEFL